MAHYETFAFDMEPLRGYFGRVADIRKGILDKE